MKIKILAAGLAATLLSSCFQSEDPEVTKNKLLLTYQTLLGVDLDLALQDPAIRYEQGTLYVGTRGKDQGEFALSIRKDDPARCQIYVSVDGKSAMQSIDALARYTVNLNKVYLGKPDTVVNGAGFAFGRVAYEPSSIDGTGQLPLKTLGTKLGNVANGDVNSEKNLWLGRLAALQKLCPGRNG
ncbi:hypothetical protein QE369_000746 [Agrobacterium larrymoorei]|uniref:Lipoprotein n=1 Tax=Agrobacterium larrymoorei TaxID=160699 RepID=A0AAJ2ERL7_9HYPH|nr:hypothetical protein [Agrobacterium larrymoorei]MDR6100568.1 hypothetical protein [Agrobacterium larrymoorei]